MRQHSNLAKDLAEKVVKDIRRAPGRLHGSCRNFGRGQGPAA